MQCLYGGPGCKHLRGMFAAPVLRLKLPRQILHVLSTDRRTTLKLTVALATSVATLGLLGGASVARSSAPAGSSPAVLAKKRCKVVVKRVRGKRRRVRVCRRVTPRRAPILVGAGDIAAAPPGTTGGDEATAKLLDATVAANPARVTVFTAGDNAYDSGASAQFSSYYQPTWGRQKAITWPSPGNHDYLTPRASGYFAYFGAAAGDSARGYYVYTRGAWRIYSLNSEIAHGAGSAQERWLRTDLAAHASVTCVLAYWHRPRFSSGTPPSDASLRALWQALYDYGGDVVVSGHNHSYQRFAPQSATGKLDVMNGVREYVVGTGGNGHHTFTAPISNTEAYNTNTYGVFKLTLHPASYDFEFLPQAGKTYNDKATGLRCH